MPWLGLQPRTCNILQTSSLQWHNLLWYYYTFRCLFVMLSVLWNIKMSTRTLPSYRAKVHEIPTTPFYMHGISQKWKKKYLGQLWRIPYRQLDYSFNCFVSLAANRYASKNDEIESLLQCIFSIDCICELTLCTHQQKTLYSPFSTTPFSCTSPMLISTGNCKTLTRQM